jgi:hypothetical protein
MMYEWKGHASPAMGWRYEPATMERLDAEGRIWYPDSTDKRPQLKRYLDEMAGTLATNVWTDIAPINSQAKERLGYPTQKPLAWPTTSPPSPLAIRTGSPVGPVTRSSDGRWLEVVLGAAMGPLGA